MFTALIKRISVLQQNVVPEKEIFGGVLPSSSPPVKCRAISGALSHCELFTRCM